jgi:hypothetical protein
MKNLITAMALVLSMVFPGALFATDVGGIISSDTVWDLAHSPYTIVSEVQIANGVTLTIQPGVVVTGVVNDRTYAPGLIKVWGNLRAVGTRLGNITFNDVSIFGEDDRNVVVNIQFAHLISGHLWVPAMSTGTGNAMLTLLDSKLEDYTIIVAGTKGDSHIERNIFVKSHQNLFGALWDNTTIYVRNNIFDQSSADQWSNDFVVGLANYSGLSNGQIVFEFNSFLTTDQVALRDLTPLDISSPGRTFNPYMLVANNYWGTTDKAVIDSMIYDRNDDLDCYTYFSYEPFLTETLPIQDPPLEPPTVDPTVENQLSASGGGGGGGCFISGISGGETFLRRLLAWAPPVISFVP